MRDYDVMLLFAFAILMATSAGTDRFVLIWTLDYTTPTPYYTTSYAAPSYSTKALEYYTTYASTNTIPHIHLCRVFQLLNTRPERPNTTRPYTPLQHTTLKPLNTMLLKGIVHHFFGIDSLELNTREGPAFDQKQNW
ncbi:hypothetical protein OUZ56_017614 [Daphnia magna]|uniref:Uncharacterized protein n=1 Tax=Daphnia magna TaxID=35525 RepID=A0ABR0AT99_9CRUS|nr:hypothetical protein OUZ56_017614 [Daphnia magna]